MTLNEFIPLIMAAAVVASFVIGRVTAAKTDGEGMGVIKTQNEQMLAALTELKQLASKNVDQIAHLNERIVKVETEQKQIWHQLKEGKP